MCPVALRVRDAMENQVVSVDASKSVTDALRTMVEKGTWSLVVTRSGLPEGVITERDILRRCYAKNLDPIRTKLESVMSNPIITIEPDAPLGDAMTVMADKNIRRLYAVENGRIVGRITQTDAFRRMLDVLFALSAIA
jgi:CBS domain-containing protein